MRFELHCHSSKERLTPGDPRSNVLLMAGLMPRQHSTAEQSSTHNTSINARLIVEVAITRPPVSHSPHSWRPPIRQSIHAWLSLDPRVLQVIFLPILIFASAFNAQFHILERRLGQVGGSFSSNYFLFFDFCKCTPSKHLTFLLESCVMGDG